MDVFLAGHEFKEDLEGTRHNTLWGGRKDAAKRRKNCRALTPWMWMPFLPSDIFLTSSATLGIAWIIVSVFQLPVSPRFSIMKLKKEGMK